MKEIIYKEDAINAIENLKGMARNRKIVSKESAVYALKELPPALTERKKGKWVNCYTDGFGNMCKCSECGARIDIQEKFRSFFCYHCGADMRDDVLPSAQPTQCNSSNVLRHPQCANRTELGNCDPVGGFCTSVPKEMCDAQKHEKENITDTISRKAAIDAVHKNYDVILDFTSDGQTISSSIEDILSDLPSAQADLPIKEKCAFCPHCNNCDVNDDLSIQPCVDTISRQAVIENICTMLRNCFDASDEMIESVKITVGELPSAQPEFDKEKISELLMRLYLMGLVHLTKDSIVRRRRQHYCEELWKTIFHDDEFPVWMNWS